MIIWYESPMISKTFIASVDSLLQNLMSNNKCFGGKDMVFSGDFFNAFLLLFDKAVPLLQVR